MSTTELPAVAKKIFHHCKKCETDRYQVVLAHPTARTAKLECEVCKSKNTLKLESAAKSRSAVPRKSAASTKIANHVARWSELRDKNGDKPKPYNMKAAFEPGVALEHPKFGLGFVVAVSGNAMQVIFEDAERALVHNRP